MNIRTKLALALVSASLLSMGALGYFAYASSTELLGEITARQLDALAESKKRDLTQVLDGWHESVRLIRSRTRLREALRAHNTASDPGLIADLDQILRDVEASGHSIRRITLFDPDGEQLVSSGSAAPSPVWHAPADERVQFSDIWVEADGSIGVAFHAGVRLDGESIGSLETIFRGSAIQALTADYTGLGETGETYVVAATPSEQFLVLNALRHSPDTELLSGPLGQAPTAAAAAIVGQASVLAEAVTDYRGEPVLAATRSLPDLAWGIVVKVDEAEERQRSDLLLETLLDLGLSIGALTILGGTLLGFRLARPIRELAHVVDLARHGDTRVRAAAHGDDEIAFLARSVNDLLDQTRDLADPKTGK
jgi:hypothetical protein